MDFENLGLSPVSGSPLPGDQSIEENLGLTDGVPMLKNKTKRLNYNLNTELLLSKRGLPELRRYASNFKFKRHQPSRLRRDPRRDKFVNSVAFQNLTRILQMYQVWGHNIFPKARLADFIDLVKKTGNKKEIKAYRIECIEEEVARIRGLEHGFGIDIGEDAGNGDNLKNTNSTNDNLPNRQSQSVDEDEDDEEIRRPTRTNNLFVGDDYDDSEPAPTSTSQPPDELESLLTRNNDDNLDDFDLADFAENEADQYEDEMDVMRELGI
ncbi:unnamed protein product [Kuraishia capsulata CBS 1993]|uniref:Chromosome segregation in meiosis protein n=1 Tax=Kuraishia capsulata CBS 1993 TaxID=1382522 RepID=W6MTU3_9ASCO|nr:uncharacterized protein KUCA_T00005912001 [Kuraishia capsulata CBS 1993]CDK29918.1 unnamed protein product [Kuraishia capsulata CBS 1993]